MGQTRVSERYRALISGTLFNRCQRKLWPRLNKIFEPCLVTGLASLVTGVCLLLFYVLPVLCGIRVLLGLVCRLRVIVCTYLVGWMQIIVNLTCTRRGMMFGRLGFHSV